MRRHRCKDRFVSMTEFLRAILMKVRGQYDYLVVAKLSQIVEQALRLYFFLLSAIHASGYDARNVVSALR